MCTAISFCPSGHYFGRTLDLEYHYNETVTVAPRGFDFGFLAKPSLKKRYSIIGMATVADGYPLYYDAMNEKGLAAAGLNFPDNASYLPRAEADLRIAPFEFIPWVLSQCESVDEAAELLKATELETRNFSEAYPVTPLHWLISDKKRSITVEPIADGLKIYENAVGVLTNNPPFPYHIHNLANYMNLTKCTPENRFGAPETTPYSRGLGAFGLPGDLSSASRFIRAAFVKTNSVCKAEKLDEINQFFHILGSVEQQRGCVMPKDGEYEITVYTSCADLDSGIYYYTTYDNRRINGVDIRSENLDGTELSSFALLPPEAPYIQNSSV